MRHHGLRSALPHRRSGAPQWRLWSCPVWSVPRTWCRRVALVLSLTFRCCPLALDRPIGFSCPCAFHSKPQGQDVHPALLRVLAPLATVIALATVKHVVAARMPQALLKASRVGHNRRPSPPAAGGSLASLSPPPEGALGSASLARTPWTRATIPHRRCVLGPVPAMSAEVCCGALDDRLLRYRGA